MPSATSTGRLVREPRRETGCLAWLRLLLLLVAACAVGIVLRAEADTSEEMQALFAATWRESPPPARAVEAVLTLGRRGRPFWKGGQFVLTDRFRMGWEGPHLVERPPEGTARSQRPPLVRHTLPAGSFLWIVDDGMGMRASGPLPADGTLVLGFADVVWVHWIGTDSTVVVRRNGEPLPE